MRRSNSLIRCGLTLAASWTMVGVLAAQQPTTPPDRTRPQAETQRDNDDDAADVVASGCLKQEKDVPGGQPNVAERAGITEDFILTSAKLTRGTLPSDAQTRSPQSGGMSFKITGIDDEKLRSHVNKQVEVQGRFARAGMARMPNPATQPPATRPADEPARPADQSRTASAPDEVQEIRATSIRMVAATCSKGTN